MGIRVFGLSFTVACLIGSPVCAQEEKLLDQELSVFIDNIPAFTSSTPLCLDNEPTLEAILALVNQTKQCIELKEDEFSFKNKNPQLKELTISKISSLSSSLTETKIFFRSYSL